MCVHKYYRWRLCSVTKLSRYFIENPVYPLINQRITPSPHARFLSSLCSTTKQAFPCYYNPLCAAADKSLSCLCHPSPIFFHFFFFLLLLLLLLLCIYIYIYIFFLNFIYVYIWFEKNILKVEFLINKHQATLICYQKPPGTNRDSEIFVENFQIFACFICSC